MDSTKRTFSMAMKAFTNDIKMPYATLERKTYHKAEQEGYYGPVWMPQTPTVTQHPGCVGLKTFSKKDTMHC